MHDVAWRGKWIYVRSKDAQKQLARTSLSTFAPIVSAHLYCARLHAQIHMPRHASSARAKYWNEQW